MTQSFSEGTVAFLDVLGFSKLVKDAEADVSKRKQLYDLVQTLEAHVQFEQGKKPHPAVSTALFPQWIFISDSIIVSSLNDAGDDRDIAAVAVKTIQIANKLLDMGYLIRGGISRGNVWQRPGNIFGTAYMDAYHQETTTNHPRVQLTKQAADAWRASQYGSHFPIIIDESDPMIDLYHPYYCAGSGTFEDYFDKVDNAISVKLAEHLVGTPPYEKWSWARDFSARSRGRHCP